MKITENFLPDDVFKYLEKYCYSTHSRKIDIGGKEISVMDTPSFIIPYLKTDAHELILSFIRESYDGFDNSLNIHADNRLNGIKIAKASVLYINNPKGVTENGTAFYSHEYYGLELPDDVSDEEHDRLLVEDANNPSKWQKVVSTLNVRNRYLEYNANLFHSKYPANIDNGKRVVMVSFFKKSK